MAFRHVLQEVVSLARESSSSENLIAHTCHRSGFHRGLPALCVAWGLVCTFQGFVTSYGGLVAARELHPLAAVDLV